MDRIHTLGLVAMATCLCLVGCGPTRGASLSPDAQVIAYNNNDTVVIHSFVDRRADRRIQIREAEAPSYSPDGNWLVVPAEKKTFLMNRDGEQVGLLPKISPPIAWNPDSSEFVGRRGSTAVVVHIRSRSVVRTYDLPIEPTSAVWMGPGRNMAFCSDDALATVVGGRVFHKKLRAANVSLGFDTQQGRLKWVETAALPSLKNLLSKLKLPTVDPVTVNSCTPELTDVRVLRDSVGSEVIPNAKPNLAFVTVESVSPNGRYVALSLIFDESPHGILHRYRYLHLLQEDGVLVGHAQEQERIKREIKDLEMRLRFRIEFVVKDVDANSSPFKVIFDSKVEPAIILFKWPVLAWAQDSSCVAIVSATGETRQKVVL